MIDTHAHLNDSKFGSDLDEVIARAGRAGVEAIVVCGCDLPSSRAAVGMASRFEGIYATVGIHPHEARHCTESAIQEIEELACAPKVLAIGEIGLDFHYDFSPRPDQFSAFEAQVEMAGRLGLPIVVHSRESNPEALAVLRQRAGEVVGCVFHCFSGDEDFAREVLEMGYYIGVDGPVTYKASEKLRRVVGFLPLDRLLLETDCPYLTPEPFRGKRNEPAYVRYVADEVARVKGVTVEEMDRVTTRNAGRLFPRLAR